jgi:glycosyltransferase involved in cell wall biosynthesis
MNAATQTPETADPELSRRLRILVFAYACEPVEGSEPGAGWGWARVLAALGDAHVMTRSNNRQAIEAHLAELPERARLHFHYVDLPAWARFWKRGQRGVRVYYLLWQLAAVREARRVSRHSPFDLVWHLTLANAWLGSLAWRLNVPFVYGPVGGGVAPPLRLLPTLGFRGVSYEGLRALARAAGRYANPFARLAWRHADLILVQNPETAAWLPRRHREKSVVCPNALVAPAAAHAVRAHPQMALFAARLIPWKGGALAIRAITLASGWTLCVCGSGPDERRLRRLTEKLGVTERVRFLGWVAREEVLRLMEEEAQVLLHPSLHDDSPFVVAEAAVRGLPVVGLDLGGPPLLARRSGLFVTSRSGGADVAAALAAALSDAEAMEVEADDEWLPERRAEVVAQFVSQRLKLDAIGLMEGAT